MKAIGYGSPFVPPEWIAAHGIEPRWLPLDRVGTRAPASLRRGVCPFAGALIDAAPSETESAALVLTTVCDQMRYAATLLEQDAGLPVFLMNVPSTWQTATARGIYLDELRRLGRFFMELGGRTPAEETLARVMLRYDAARREICRLQPRLSGRQFAEAVARLRGGDTAGPKPASASFPNGGVPLALVGGPLPPRDFTVLDQIEQAGARIVLDATEAGGRTLPAVFDPGRTRQAPLEELAHAYFGSIPDVFRRPNEALYAWLGRELDARKARGILVRRYLWCDLWQGELQRLKAWSPVPVLDLDEVDEDGGWQDRALGRLEAFLEILA